MVSNEWVAERAELVRLARQLSESRGGAQHDRWRQVLLNSTTADRILLAAEGKVLQRLRELSPADLSSLEVLGSYFDLLGPIRRERDEVSYTHAIAFLMCPKRNGEIGEQCQRAFLSFVSEKSRDWSNLDAAEMVGKGETGSEAWTHLKERQGIRVDVTLETVTSLIWIEAKVDSSENEASDGGTQLQTYQSRLRDIAATRNKSCCLVFLTVEEDAAKSSVVEVPFLHMTFKDLLLAWLPIAAKHDGPSGFYLRAFLKSVAVFLYSLGAVGPVEAWPLAIQMRVLNELYPEGQGRK